MRTKPSDFLNYPWDSISQNGESEEIALNIMVILKRTGDNFRSLVWAEYELERKKDGNFSGKERYYFDRVIGYCKSADRAALFSPNWEV